MRWPISNEDEIRLPARAFVWSVVIGVVLAILGVSSYAREPVIVKAIGIASSMRVNCDAKRLFAEFVAKQRSEDKNKDEVTGMMIARAIEAGVSWELQAQIKTSVDYVWVIEGDPHAVGKTVMLQCLDGRV